MNNSPFPNPGANSTPSQGYVPAYFTVGGIYQPVTEHNSMNAPTEDWIELTGKSKTDYGNHLRESSEVNDTEAKEYLDLAKSKRERTWQLIGSLNPLGVFDNDPATLAEAQNNLSVDTRVEYPDTLFDYNLVNRARDAIDQRETARYRNIMEELAFTLEGPSGEDAGQRVSNAHELGFTLGSVYVAPRQATMRSELANRQKEYASHLEQFSLAEPVHYNCYLDSINTAGSQNQES
nr:hypothetical protein L204_06170 [Cryptococcus depauperatus CBS 7855]